MLDKTYQPSDVEPRIYAAWEASGAFSAGRPGLAPDADPFCIVIPPPNVTGSLHMGHALNNTIQDILCRFWRMRGRDVLWQPGMDHAGIATQMVVERQLMERQEPDRRAMGREAFISRVWEWKAESGGMIINQLKRLGASCDWSRERFTMDEGLSRAVTKVFVELYRAGLIYKDKRLVNWDPMFQTAISDLEVQQVETKGYLWHFRYPLKNGETYRFPIAFDDNGKPTEWEERDYITVATTRPETMLGDTAVAVHPDDERYKTIVEKTVILPLVGRKIPIIADEYADPSQGSGAVKITPAHDFNDSDVGKRHGLRLVNVLDAEAQLVLADNADFLNGFIDNRYGLEISNLRSGARSYMRALAAELLRELGHADLAKTVETLDGVDRFVARERVVAMMETLGLVERIEEHIHVVPHGDRSGAAIEPWPTDQWYADAATLAQPAIAAVEAGETQFVPETWAKTYFEWMRNIQPWCISRQLWWGHQIPAWYGPDRELFVAEDAGAALKLAQAHYGCPIHVEYPADMQAVERFASIASQVIDIRQGRAREVTIERDPDVLDTWFSSALWPFSTLGWPDETPELARFYKTDVLVTAFDIIFFWVARMMMMGLHFMKEVPFHTVYIHALVRDDKGQKMSKSKGNVIDPLELIDEHGADALRFTLAAMAAQGRDIKLSGARVEGYRNFATKLWNAARFIQMNGCARVKGFDPSAVNETVNRWIVGEAARAAASVTGAIEAYKFNDAAGAIYHFLWHVYCDWYVELIKPVLAGEGEAADETRATAAFTLDEALKLLHPFMPFITEELWDRLGETGPARDTMLVTAPWPDGLRERDSQADDEIGWLIGLISEIRSVRAEMNVPAGARVPVIVRDAAPATEQRLARHREIISRLARLSGLALGGKVPAGAIQIVHGEATVALPLAEIIDLGAERDRLARELGRIDQEIAKIDGKLGNDQFMARAPAHVVEEQRERRADASGQRARLESALERLSAAI